MPSAFARIKAKIHENLIAAMAAAVLAGATAAFATAWSWIKSEIVAAGGVPAGAVMAFDRSASDGACPPNWQRFDPADGRVIVGAGGVAKPGLTVYPPYRDDPDKARGGLEQVLLGISVVLQQDGRRVSDYQHGDGPWANGPNPAAGGSTASTSVQFDNRQPFISLYFCRKN